MAGQYTLDTLSLLLRKEGFQGVMGANTEGSSFTKTFVKGLNIGGVGCGSFLLEVTMDKKSGLLQKAVLTGPQFNPKGKSTQQKFTTATFGSWTTLQGVIRGLPLKLKQARKDYKDKYRVYNAELTRQHPLPVILELPAGVGYGAASPAGKYIAKCGKASYDVDLQLVCVNVPEPCSGGIYKKQTCVGGHIKLIRPDGFKRPWHEARIYVKDGLVYYDIIRYNSVGAEMPKVDTVQFNTIEITVRKLHTLDRGIK